jgi:hypothetical protein
VSRSLKDGKPHFKFERYEEKVRNWKMNNSVGKESTGTLDPNDPANYEIEENNSSLDKLPLKSLIDLLSNYLSRTESVSQFTVLSDLVENSKEIRMKLYLRKSSKSK